MTQMKITSFLDSKRNIQKPRERSQHTEAPQKGEKQVVCCLPFFLILPQHQSKHLLTKQHLQSLLSSNGPNKIKAFIKQNIQAKLKADGTNVAIDKIDIKNLDEIESHKFWNQAIPDMLRSALTHLPPLDILHESENKLLKIKRQTAHAILSHMFLGTMPDQLYTQGCSFSFLMMEGKAYNKDLRLEKLKCFIAYFEAFVSFSKEQREQDITFRRIFSKNKEISNRDVELVEVRVTKENIEQHSNEVMVDFAHRKIGGGVLTDGAVQEEILFCLFPELLVGRLLCPAMNENEAIIVQGFRRFSNYQGYSKNFRHRPLLYKDHNKASILVAIDALDYTHFSDRNIQFNKIYVDREIHKAAIGFSRVKQLNDDKDIVTGKWGCGVFKGDAQLKFLIQWLVCSCVGTEMVFVDWGGESSDSEYLYIVEELRRRKTKTRELRSIISKYEKFKTKEEVDITLFDYILDFYIQGGLS